MSDDKRSRPSDPAPFYEAHVFMCTNDRGPDAERPSCARSGSEKMRDYMKAATKAALRGAGSNAKVRVNSAGCLDRCELGCTMVIYPEGVWYHYDNRADLDEIIESHMLKGKRVERLLMTTDQEELRPEQKTAQAAE